MSQMTQRKQTRSIQYKAVFILLVLILTLSLWPQPKIAQAQWTDNGNNMTTSDSVGIGTTGPPATKLEVGGVRSIRLDSTLGSVKIMGQSTSWATLYGFTSTNGTDLGGLFAYGGDSTLNWFNIGKLYNDGMFTILNSGNVGIGTTSPSSKLQVAGDLKIGSTNPLTLNKSAVKTFDLNMTNEGSAGHAFRIGLGGWGTDYFSIENSVHDTIYHKFTANGNSFLNAIGGNVGIGTTSPNQKLEVNGVGRFTDANGFSIGGDSGRDRIQAGYATGQRFRFLGTSNAYATVGVQSLTVGNSYTDINTAPTDGLIVKGNVGIGTASPTAKLDVVGLNNGSSVRFTANTNTDVAGAVFTVPGVTNWSLGNRPSGAFVLNNGNIFAGTDLMTVLPGGNVGIGTPTPSTKLHVVGDVTVTGNIAAKYQDVAEWVTSPKAMPAGTVVMLHPDQTNQVLPSMKAYDTRVAGVISEMPGILLGEAGDGKVKVATTGRVKVKVDATKGAVQVGDLLVTSDKEGIAMKSEPLDLGGVLIHRPGTLIGKALEPLSEGEGEILVLLSLQ